jgi:hypothetical protein
VRFRFRFRSLDKLTNVSPSGSQITSDGIGSILAASFQSGRLRFFAKVVFGEGFDLLLGSEGKLCYSGVTLPEIRCK